MSTLVLLAGAITRAGHAEAAVTRYRGALVEEWGSSQGDRVVVVENLATGAVTLGIRTRRTSVGNLTFSFPGARRESENEVSVEGASTLRGPFVPWEGKVCVVNGASILSAGAITGEDRVRMEHCSVTIILTCPDGNRHQLKLNCAGIWVRKPKGCFSGVVPAIALLQ